MHGREYVDLEGGGGLKVMHGREYVDLEEGGEGLLKRKNPT